MGVLKHVTSKCIYTIYHVSSIAIFQYILKKTQILIDIEVLKRVVPQNMDLWLSERVLQMFWMLQHMILQSIADNMIV